MALSKNETINDQVMLVHLLVRQLSSIVFGHAKLTDVEAKNSAFKQVIHTNFIIQIPH